jgi:hypothetical protein
MPGRFVTGGERNDETIQRHTQYYSGTLQAAPSPATIGIFRPFIPENVSGMFSQHGELFRDSYVE